MNEFKVIAVMNEAMLKLLKDKNADYDKNLKIKEYLKDESVFFKINQSTAYKILQSVGIKENKLEDVYKKLTSPDVYYDLLNRGKIKKEDSIIIKYDTYSPNDLFKKRN